MLTTEATPEMIKQWKAVWREYKGKLRPNKKSGTDVAKYLANKYSLRELHDDRAAQVVIDNILLNHFFAVKLPDGSSPSVVTYIVENAKAGEKLYQQQDEMFGGEIFVGIDLISGFYMVEGSSLLWDELCAFQGLDEADIENYFCVAQYINALDKFKAPD